MPTQPEEENNQDMTAVERTMIGLLVAIAGQTTYTTYRNWRSAPSTSLTPVFIDTSVLIDGRIVAIAQTGFIPGTLIVPRSVVGELQFLADNADTEKRERARRGLDVVKELQAIDGLEVELLQDGSKAEEGVDERLLTLAKKHRGMLCTIDFNLNKVAQVESIRVLNVNELARQLRMTHLPGEHIELELTDKGSDGHQAVGHLSDGTMVVVEQARKQIGQTATVEIIRSLQTAAGRMMFAKLLSTQAKSEQPSDKQLPAKNHQANIQKPKGRSPKNPTRNSELDGANTKKSTKSNTSAKVAQPQSRRKSVSTTPETQRSTKKPRRMPSSAQRESSLIDLVNSQT
jgi:rRNA-processing protein FCF1